MPSRGVVRIVACLGLLGAAAFGLTLVDDDPAMARQVGVTCKYAAGDTKLVQGAINASAVGDEVVFHGRCLVTSTIKLLGGRAYRGDSASTSLVAASGSNLPAVVASDSWLENRDYTGNPISLRDLTVNGNRSGNPSGGDGVVIRSWDTQIENVNIRNANGNGLTIAASSRNGTAIATGNTQVNGTIDKVFVTDSGKNGIYAQEEPGDNALTDWNLINSWVGGSGGSGIQLDNGAGWVISRNHVYDDAQNGISVDRMFGTSLSGNNIEDFGAGFSGIRVTLQGEAASEIANNRVFQAQSKGGSTFITVEGVVYGTGDVSVTDNVVRGNGTGTGLSYSGGGRPLMITSTGNSVQDVTVPRSGGSPGPTY